LDSSDILYITARCLIEIDKKPCALELAIYQPKFKRLSCSDFILPFVWVAIKYVFIGGIWWGIKLDWIALFPFLTLQLWYNEFKYLYIILEITKTYRAVNLFVKIVVW